MKKSLKLFLTMAAATIVIVVSSEPMFARGGDAAISSTPRAISGGFRNPGSRCHNPTRSRLRPIDANGDIGASTDVLLALARRPYGDGVMSNGS
jgi:hypothetical protein